MANPQAFDSEGNRLYRFRNLMERLTSPAWSVIKIKQKFVFIPTAYKKMGGGRP